MRNLKRLAALMIVFSLVFVSSASAAAAVTEANAEQISAEKMMADALLVRPIAIVATLVGTAAFIVSLPFSALGGNTRDAGRKLVVKPATFAFKRPLGDF